jgi:hypothetical protein
MYLMIIKLECLLLGDLSLFIGEGAAIYMYEEGQEVFSHGFYLGGHTFLDETSRGSNVLSFEIIEGKYNYLKHKSCINYSIEVH